MKYRNDVSIDRLALDQEWLVQPNLMMNYCKLSADTQKDLDEAKEALDVVKAEIDNDIRGNKEKYGMDKITDTAIDRMILLQPAYKQAFTNYLLCKHENDMAKAAVRSMEHKKDALENLVKLFGMGYFSSPKAMNIDRDWEKAEKQKEVDSRIRIKRLPKDE